MKAMFCANAFYFRSKLLERHAEGLPTRVIFLNTVTARLGFVPTTSTSWTACPVKTVKLLHTAMRVDARRMVSSANNSLHQVHLIMCEKRPLQLIKPQTVRCVYFCSLFRSLMYTRCARHDFFFFFFYTYICLCKTLITQPKV